SLCLRVERTRLWWGTSAGATSYDVVRGSLDQLRSTVGNFASPLVTQLCLADNRADTYWLHAETPAAGQGVWYLIRAQPGGTYDSGAPSQSGSRDGEIAACGNAWPSRQGPVGRRHVISRPGRAPAKADVSVNLHRML